MNRALLATALLSAVLTGCGKGSTQSALNNFLQPSQDSGLASTDLSFSPGLVDFGSVALDVGPRQQQVSLINHATVPLYVGTLSQASGGSAALDTLPGAFTVLSNACPVGAAGTLAAGASCAISLQYSPEAEGSATAGFTAAFGSDAGNLNLQTQLQAKAVTAAPTAGNAALDFTPPLYDFPATALGKTATAIFTLTNATGADVTLTALDPLTAPLAISANTCPINPAVLAKGASCTVTVSYSPQASSAITGVLTAEYSVSNQTGATSSSTSNKATAGLTAATLTVGNSAIAFAPATLAFGPLHLTTGATTQTVNLSNTSAAPLYMLGLSGFDQNFTLLTNSCPLAGTPLAAGAACNITVQCLPQVAGPLAANLTVSYALTPSSDNPFQATAGMTATGVSLIVFAGITSIGPDAADTTTQLTVNWQPATQGSVSRYFINHVVAGKLVYVADVPASSVSYVDTGLAPGSSYTYVVKAADTLGIQDANTAQATASTDPLGTFIPLTIGSLAEGQTTATANLQCISGVAKTPAPQPTFAIESQSDADANCTLTGGGPYQLSCSPNYKTGHSNWSAHVVVSCMLDGSEIDQTVQLQIAHTGRPPVLDPIADQNVVAGSPMTSVVALDNGSNLDADGDPLTYTCTYGQIINNVLTGAGTNCSQLPATSFSFNATTGAMTWTPSRATVFSGPATYQITLTASDGQSPPLTGSRSFRVSVTGVVAEQLSSSAASGTYKIGDTVPILLTFSAPVAVTGTPTLTLATVSGGTAVPYTSGSGSATLLFNYVVSPGEQSALLDVSSANALALSGGSIVDLQGNPAVLMLPAPGTSGSLGANIAIAIDAIRAVVSSVTSTTANGTYGPGSVLNIQAIFTKAVTVSGGTPTLTLDTGATAETASYTATTGGTTLNFTYTVQIGDSSPALDYFGTNSLALGGATIKDNAGNNVLLSLPPLVSTSRLAATKTLVIAGVPPTVTAVTTSTPSGTYGPGATIGVQVAFSSAVNVGGSPEILMATGTTTRYATYTSGSGSNHIQFNYHVQPGDFSTGLDYASTVALSLNSGTIQDTVGNSATLTLPAPGAVGSLSASAAITLDSQTPVVTGVTSSKANGAYKAGTVIPLQVSFSEAVTVSGTPTLSLATGTSRTAVFSSISGSVATFNYTVQNGDSASPLDYASSSALALAGGSIINAAQTPAVLTLAAPGSAGSLSASKTITILTATPVAPVITTPTSTAILNTATPTLTGTKPAGTFVTIYDGASVLGTVATDGTGTWTFSPSSPLAQGTHSLTAYAVDSASNSSTVSNAVGITVDTVAPAAPTLAVTAAITNNTAPTFTGTAEASSTVKLYANGTLAATTTAAVNGSFSATPTSPLANGTYSLTATATDAAGNISSTSTAQIFQIDTTIPTVQTVTSPAANGYYIAGQTLQVAITFSKSVLVTGTPQLTLATNSMPNATASYVSGSGSAVLVFSVTTVLGQNSSRLDYAATTSLALNGGTILDAAGNAAALTLPAPTTAGSLSANKNLVLMTTPPVPPVITSPAAASSVPNTTPTIVGTKAASTSLAVYDSGTLLGTLPSASGTSWSFVAGSGLAQGAHALTATATDAAGNVSAASGTVSFNVDTIAPAAPVVTALPAATNNVTPTFTGTAEAGSTVNVYANGVLIGTTTAGSGGGAWSITPAAALSNGNTYAISATATDAAGNISQSSSAQSLLVNTTAPVITNVTSPLANGYYVAGQTVSVAVTFASVVNVTGTPQLTLATNSTPAAAGNYASGSGSNTLLFTFTAATGQNSQRLDYASTAALALNGGTIVDSAGNTAILTLPTPGAAGSLSANKNLILLTTPPAAPAITSPTAASYVNNATPTLTGTTPTLTSVTVYDSGTVSVGTVAASAATAWSLTLATPLSQGSHTLTAKATDAAGNVSAASAAVSFTLDSLAPAAPVVTAIPVAINTTTPSFGGTAEAGSTVKLYANATLIATTTAAGGGSWTVTGTLASGNTYAITATATDLAGNTSAASGAQSVTVNTIAPTVVQVTSSLANGYYVLGSTVTASVLFSEPVTVTGTPQLTFATASTPNAVGTYTSGSGSSTLVFTFTAASGQNSAHLDYASTTALALNGGTIVDAAGNSAVLTLPAPGAAGSLAANSNLVLETTPPAAPVIVNPAANSATDNSKPTISGSKPGSTSLILYDGGTQIASAAMASATTWSITLATALADGTHPLSATVTDQAGNTSGAPTTLSLRVITTAPAAPVLSAPAANVNSLQPAVAGTAAASSTVTVYANGIQIATTTANAGGSWTVAPASPLSNGAYAFTANATDVAGNVSALSSALNTQINTTAPTVTSVIATSANGTYVAGQTVTVAVSFSENVNVSGSPQLALATGGSPAQATYTSGNGTANLVFSLTVASGYLSSHLEYSSITALTLNGGSITDAAGNNATLTLPTPGGANSLSANSTIVIDAVSPAVASISTTAAAGTYGPGAVIPIIVNFTKTVSVTGATPTLTLALSPSNRAINYTSGSGSSALTFNYTVPAGDNSSHLDCSSQTALALAGAAIKDIDGNAAVLTLPTPGTASSLGANAALNVKGNLHSPTLIASVSTQTVAVAAAITAVDVNDTTYGNDTDSDGDMISYTCAVIANASSWGAGTGAVPCAALPSTSYSFATGSGILNWTPASGSTTSSAVTPYAFQVTGTSSSHTAATAYFTVTVKPAPFTTPWIFTAANAGGTGSQYTFDSTQIGYGSSNLSLLAETPADTADITAGFAGGTGLGAAWDSSNSILRLANTNGCNAASTNCAAFDASWTPAYANIVSYWPLDGTAGLALANSIAITATVGAAGITSNANGSGMERVSGHLGQAVFFDGVDDYIGLGTNAIGSMINGAGGVTVSAWVKYAALNANAGQFDNVIFSGLVGNAAAAAVMLNIRGDGTKAGAIQLSGRSQASDSLQTLTSTVLTQPNAWYHVVGSFNFSTGTASLTVNGLTSAAIGLGFGSTTFVNSGTPTYQDSISSPNGVTSSAPLNGSIDEVGVWNTALTSSQAQAIYARQSAAYAGVFNSRVFDIGAPAAGAFNWTTLSWSSTLPLQKQLSNSSESTTNYANLASSSLMNGIVALFHFDESSWSTVAGQIIDSSGNGHNASISTVGAYQPVPTSTSVLGNGALFSNASGTSSMYIQLPNASGTGVLDNLQNSSYTLSAWVNPSSVPPASSPVSGSYGILVKQGYNMGLWYTSGQKFQAAHWISQSPYLISINSASSYAPGQFHHVVSVIDTVNGNLSLYVDGQLQAYTSWGSGIASLTGFGGNNWMLGSGSQYASPPLPNLYNGIMDEVAIWSRALSGTEVTQLYRRGGNRLKYQVRSCSTANCGSASWLGPDGTSQTYFSEYFNKTSQAAAPTGQTLATPPTMTFSNFTGLTLAANRYFQYRTILESDDTNALCNYGSGPVACSPELLSTTLGPNFYSTAAPTIVSDTPISYYNLTSLAETQGGAGCAGGITYQLSPDSSSWYYWNGSAWAVSNSTAAQSNSASILSSNASAYAAAAGSGSLYFRAYLNSNGTSPCQLRQLSVTGNH